MVSIILVHLSFNSIKKEMGGLCFIVSFASINWYSPKYISAIFSRTLRWTWCNNNWMFGSIELRTRHFRIYAAHCKLQVIRSLPCMLADALGVQHEFTYTLNIHSHALYRMLLLCFDSLLYIRRRVKTGFP